jgi:hypothetical protein
MNHFPEAPPPGARNRPFALERNYDSHPDLVQPPKQIGDFLVAVTVVRVPNLRPLAKETIGFIEEEQPILVLCLAEQPVELLSAVPSRGPVP